MNQILKVKDDDNNSNQINNKEDNKKKKFVFKAQFVFSIFFILLISFIFIYLKYTNLTYDKYSNNLTNNYNIYRLYADSNMNNSQMNNDESGSIIGTIEIPIIELSYPILSNLTDNFLKIAPCKFYGDIKSVGNLCIAGHNYDNYKFFSNIKYLKENDIIYIYDNSNNKYTYKVFDNYEVENNDLSPIYNLSNDNTKELTLVTCNNITDKRIIVKANIEI